MEGIPSVESYPRVRIPTSRVAEVFHKLAHLRRSRRSSRFGLGLEAMTCPMTLLPPHPTVARRCPAPPLQGPAIMRIVIFRALRLASLPSSVLAEVKYDTELRCVNTAPREDYLQSAMPYRIGTAETDTSTCRPVGSPALPTKPPEIGRACEASRVTPTRIRLAPATSPLVGSYSTQPAPGR